MLTRMLWGKGYWFLKLWWFLNYGSVNFNGASLLPLLATGALDLELEGREARTGRLWSWLETCWRVRTRTSYGTRRDAHKEAVTVLDAGDAGSYALALQVQVQVLTGARQSSPSVGAVSRALAGISIGVELV